MKVSSNEVIKVSLKDVRADENQPRKMFDPEKLANLKHSVERHGIMNPLIVEKLSDHYLLVDGERRFRVATELKLKEVPVIVIAPQTRLERVLQQFHIQEQHEGWTASEKALTVLELADELNLTPEEICQELGIHRRTAGQYLSFAKILAKENFHRNNVGIKWAAPINTFKAYLRKFYRDVIEEVFDMTEEMRWENAIITRLKNGTIQSPRDFSRMKDSLTKQPSLYKKFLEDETVTPDQMFVKSRAKGAFHLRQLRNNAYYLMSNIDAYSQIGDVAMDKATVNTLRNTLKTVKDLLERVGE